MSDVLDEIQEALEVIAAWRQDLDIDEAVSDLQFLQAVRENTLPEALQPSQREIMRRWLAGMFRSVIVPAPSPGWKDYAQMLFGGVLACLIILLQWHIAAPNFRAGENACQVRVHLNLHC